MYVYYWKIWFLVFQEFICFFEGGVSDWKNLFNEEQNEKMDKVFEERIARTKLGTKLKYELQSLKNNEIWFDQ